MSGLVLTAAASAIPWMLSRSSDAAVDVWTGATNTMGTATNWAANTTPVTNDSFYFNAAGAGGLDLNNNLTSSSFNVSGITFNTTAGAYVIGDGTATDTNAGNTFVLSGGITNNSAVTQTLSTPFSTGGSSPTFTQATGGTLLFAGNVNTAGGALTLSGGSTSGPGTFTFTGTLAAVLNTTANTSGGILSVGTNAGNNTILNISTTTSALDLWVGGGTTGNGAVYQSGGALTLTDSTTGISGSASDKDFDLGGAGSQGTAGYGYFAISGGSATANQIDIAGRNTGAIGVLDVQGGTVTSNNGVNMSRGNGANATYSLLNVTGGTFLFGATGSPNNSVTLTMGYQSSGGSVVNVGGGSGSAAITGGSNASTGGVDLAYNTTGLNVLNLLTNGTLTTPRVYSAADATALLNFNGGTLKATALNLGTTFLTGLGAVTVYSKGGTVDNGGTSITIGNALVPPSGSGVTSIPVSSGGSNYIGAPFVQISGTGTGATAYAQVSGGAITNIVITNPGTGYTGTPTIALQGGGATTAATFGTVSIGTNATTGGMTFQGVGNTTLTATNTYTGYTNISSGTLTLGNGSTTGTLSTSSTITDNGTLAFNRSNAVVQGVDFSGSGISGTGGITMYGSGTLTLTASNIYTGATLLAANNEKVILTNVSALAGTSTFNFYNTTGGTLDIATNGVGETAFPVNSSSGFGGTIASDLASSGPGITHSLGAATLGGGTLNIVAGPNVSGGSPAISFTSMVLSSGTGANLTIVPTTANVLIGSVNAVTSSKTLILDGTSSGNTVGPISQTSVTLSLTKSNSSTWTLNSPTSYTGATTITGGTLALGSSATLAGTPSINVGSGAILNISANPTFALTSSQVLGGSGTISGSYTQTAGTLIAGWNTSPGTLNVTGNLNLSGGTLAVNLNGNTSSASSVVNVSGSLSILAPTILNATLLGTTTVGEVFPIINFSAGTLSGSANNLTVTSRALAVSNNSSQVLVTVTNGAAANLLWASPSSSAWDIVTSQNWFNTGTNAQDYFYQADNVTFPDSTTVTLQPNINLTTTLSPGSVNVSSNSLNYNFSGPGSIAGTTGLTKTGSSVLTISNTNTFTGTANISNGSVIASGVNSLGTGPLNIGTGAVVAFLGNGTTGIIGNSSVVDNGSLVLNQSANYNAPTIIGTGTVTANNASGGISFSPNDTYSGGTYITAGQNYLGFGGTAAYTAGYANNAMGTGTVNLTGGELTISYLTPVIANNFNIGNAILHVGFQQTAVLTGTINLTGPATLACDGGTSFDFTGAMYNTAGNTTTVNYGNGLTIATTAVLFSNSSSISINSDTLTLAPPTNSNYSIPSVISSTGTSPLVMAGPGIAVLSGTNTFSGGTTISGGVLIAASNTALSTGAVALNGGVNVNAELALPGGVNISNAISVGGRTGSYGPYLDNISGNNIVSGPISLYTSGNVYAIESDAGLLTISGQITQQAGTGSRYYVFQGAGNGLVTSPLINGTAVPIVEMNGTGTWTFAGNNSYGGLTQANSGTLAFAPNYSSGIQVISLSGGLQISNGALVQVNAAAASSTRSLLETSSLSIGSLTGRLDLANNDMIVQAGTTTSLSTVFNQIGQGYGNGSWNGTNGIISTAAQKNLLTALGVILNDQVGNFQASNGTALTATFDGAVSHDGDVLVKYTYYGDTNLDGKVDGSDYANIDNGYINGLTGWYNGDFNYDNAVNGSDYTLMDNAFNQQGAQISSIIASPSAVATDQIAGSGASSASSAVPEPASLGLLGIGAIGLLGRRNRRQK
jgi:autotransporter-associated beta strand protein